ncbi:DUF2625 family protein [Planotetraspora mira]|nr:DUF2625 family protein [Planotetraspora mira]
MDELINTDDSAWPLILAEVSRSVVVTRMLPAVEERGRATLHQLQVTTRSFLGAMALHSGGMLIDHGWVRVLGGSSGVDGMPSLADANKFPSVVDPTWAPSALIVAYDVLGGAFAIKGVPAPTGPQPGEPGQMIYFAPDSMQWEGMEIGHGDWLSWLLSGGLEKFYESLRWSGWQEDANALRADQGISVMPPLWSAEAQADVAATHKRPVPMWELLGLHEEFCRQFGLPSPGFA